MKRTIAAVVILTATPSAAHAQTIYSSLPLTGASRSTSAAINAGARLALKQSGNTAVRFVALDDSIKRVGAWTPERVATDALRAAQDRKTIAYIGEFNSGASQVALPILNEAGVPMISPANTYNGLTRGGAGTRRGEPDKYYPTGSRTYFRIIPNDVVQAAAIATAMRERGCTRIGVIDDKESYGRGLAAGIRSTASRLGLKVVLHRRITRGAPRLLRRAKANCMAYAGVTANGAVRLFRNAPAKIGLFAGDGVAERAFAAHLPRSVERRTFVTVATLSPESYGLAARTNPYMAFGYEAMKLILDGMAAGATTKAALIGWLHGVRSRPSILGTYSFDAKGDTTLRTYGLYTVRGHALRFAGTISAA